MFRQFLNKIKNGKKSTVVYTIIIVVLSILAVLFAVSKLSMNSTKDTQSNTTSDASNDTVQDTASDILYPTSSILRYQIGDIITDFAYMNYNFKEDFSGDVFAQALIDVNDDGEYSDSEWVIKNKKVRVIKDFPNRFSFLLPEALKSVDGIPNLTVKLTLTSQITESSSDMNPISIHEIDITVETEILDSEFGLNIPGASEDLKRGIGLRNLVLGMDFEEIRVNTSSLPDLTGGPMDCFAIATANNLINMTSQHDRRDDLPKNPEHIITELKKDMNFNNGIIKPNFLIGKAAFVDRYDLPIRTEEIKKPTIDDLAYAFAYGDAVEISTTMIRSSSGQANTGHVLTGVSAYQDGDDAGLAVHDPATPQGTDTMDIRMSDGENQYILLDYPLWDGIVFIDAIYVQYWDDSISVSEDGSDASLPEDSEEDGSGTSLPEDSKEDGSSVSEPEDGEEDNSSTSQPDESEDEQPDDSVLMPLTPTLELAFDHVKPGEYSEVYAAITGLKPGDEVTALLYGGGQNGTVMIVEADNNGLAYVTWRIYQYGKYDVTVQLTSGTELKASISVN